MSKENKTLVYLLDNISEEWSWRVKELDDFKSAVKKSNNDLTKLALIRAGITLLYAHWEGFVKACSYNYYNFVTTKGYKLSELNDSFVAISMRKELNEIIDSNRITKQSKAISTLFRVFDKRGFFPKEIPLKTNNLKFEIFEEYCSMIGIETIPFETKRQFINQRLVGNRNIIAHGRFLPINEPDFYEIFQLTLELMKIFKNAIENAATLSIFKRVS